MGQCTVGRVQTVESLVHRFSWTSTTTFLICSRQSAEGPEAKTTLTAKARVATKRIILEGLERESLVPPCYRILWVSRLC